MPKWFPTHGPARVTRLLTLVLLLGVMILPTARSLSVAGHAHASATGRVGNDANPIKHVVFIIKENRSFDNYFGAYPPLANHIIAGTNMAGGATTARTFSGLQVPMGALDVFNRDSGGVPRDTDHRRSAAVTGYHHGHMDGFDMQVGGTNRGQNGSLLIMTQAKSGQLDTYWSYADHFVLSDQTYSSMGGPSFPNHLYSIAGQSAGAITQPVPGDHSFNMGCDAPITMTVRLNTGVSVSPCFSASQLPSLPSMLEAHPEWGVSWKYYATLTQTNPAYIWTAPNAINELRNNPAVWGSKVVTNTQFLTDVANNDLPAVSWLIPPFDSSDHPPESTCLGQNWTSTYLNALMSSPLWSSTAVFLTWDDYGGFYDHVPPPQVDGMGYGLRVPMMIISPYADHGNHAIIDTPYEFASVLAFIERLFNLPRLGNGTARDAYANDMFDAFNFSQSAIAPDIIAPLSCPAPPSGQRAKTSVLSNLGLNDGDDGGQ